MITKIYLITNYPEEIEIAVTNYQIDVVIMGTHGASGFNEFFIGSNAHKTIKKCSCPVFLFKILILLHFSKFIKSFDLVYCTNLLSNGLY